MPSCHHVIMPSCQHAISQWYPHWYPHMYPPTGTPYWYAGVQSYHHAIIQSCHHAIMPSCHHAIGTHLHARKPMPMNPTHHGGPRVALMDHHTSILTKEDDCGPRSPSSGTFLEGFGDSRHWLANQTTVGPGVSAPTFMQEPIANEPNTQRWAQGCSHGLSYQHLDERG